MDIDEHTVGLVLPFHPDLIQMQLNDTGDIDPRMEGIPCLSIIGNIDAVENVLQMAQQALWQAKWQQVEEAVIDVVEVKRDV